MKLDSKYFDELRSEIEKGFVRPILFEIINALEKIYNLQTSNPVDIRDHDEHGRVKMEDDAGKS